MVKSNQQIYLDEMARELDADLVFELLQIYRLQMEDFFKKMENVTETFSFQETTMLTHKLKSSARHVGAFDVAERLNSIEEYPRKILHPGEYQNLKQLYLTTLKNIDQWSNELK